MFSSDRMLFDPEFILTEIPKKISAVRLKALYKIFGGITKKLYCRILFGVTTAEFPENVFVLTLTHSTLL